MKQIKYVLWCDGEHDEPQQATGEHRVSLDSQAMVRLDLCDRHGKLISGIETLLERGAPIGTPAKKAASSGKSHSCPICSHTVQSRKGIDNHMRSKHDMSLAEYRVQQGAEMFDCPLCDHKSPTAQGNGVHMHFNHGMSMAEYRAQKQSELQPTLDD